MRGAAVGVIEQGLSTEEPQGERHEDRVDEQAHQCRRCHVVCQPSLSFFAGAADRTVPCSPRWLGAGGMSLHARGVGCPLRTSRRPRRLPASEQDRLPRRRRTR